MAGAPGRVRMVQTAAEGSDSVSRAGGPLRGTHVVVPITQDEETEEQRPLQGSELTLRWAQLSRATQRHVLFRWELGQM